MRKTLCALLMATSSLGFADTAPPNQINTAEVMMDALQGIPQYSNWHVIGVCYWYYVYPPHGTTTMELDYYQPDFVVTVANENKDNPWLAASLTDTVAYKAGNTLFKKISSTIFGFTTDESDGQVSSSTNQNAQGIGSITKSVDVFGAPDLSNYTHMFKLDSDVTGMMPYYYSSTDTLGRLDIAEAIKTQSYNLFDYEIGTSLVNKWSYEFPRSMTASVSNNYEASAIVAQRAADIVTNNSPLHTVHTVTDRCGFNCAISNVIENKPNTPIPHEKWQMIYPSNQPVTIGKSTLTDSPLHALGSAANKEGNGNYAYLVWRHHQGCVQAKGGIFLGATMIVPPTQKR